jgi:hypothetical protein
LSDLSWYYNVSLVLVKLGSQLALSYLMKSLSTLLFVSYIRKPVSF